MSEKDSLYIEEQESLDQPEAEKGAGASYNAAYVPVAVPPGIYQAYGTRKFRLLREAKDRIRGVLLEMDTWNVLWQVDGRRTVAEIAQNLALSLDTAIYHVECLKLMGIICPVDAIYLPEFILEKTEKHEKSGKRRKTDTGATDPKT